MAIFFTLIAVFCTSFLNAQTDSVPLTPDFRFSDGIFLNFQQVKTNSPIPKDQIITDISQWDVKYYDKLLSQKQITIMTGDGQQTIPAKDIWGYSDNGSLYIKWKDDFAKITTKGFLGHFAATEEKVTYNPYSTWYYDPYYDNYEKTREIRNFILDFNTGDIYPFTPKALLQIFQKYDPQLYAEYAKLRPRKQSKLIFVYLRKFNQRHQTYIYIQKANN